MLAIKQSHGVKKYLADEGNRASFVRVTRDLGTVFKKLDEQLPREPPRTRGVGVDARQLAPWQTSGIEKPWLEFVERTWDTAQKTLNDFITTWHGWVTKECTAAKLASYQPQPADSQPVLDRKANQRDMCQGLTAYNALPAKDRAPLTRPIIKW